MRVFLAGGTGVIGRRLIPQLVTAGHRVAATTRSAAKTAMLQVPEDAPLALDAPEPFGATVRATAEGEKLALSADGITGVVLRYGQLYGQ